MRHLVIHVRPLVHAGTASCLWSCESKKCLSSFAPAWCIRTAYLPLRPSPVPPNRVLFFATLASPSAASAASPGAAERPADQDSPSSAAIANLFANRKAPGHGRHLTSPQLQYGVVAKLSSKGNAPPAGLLEKHLHLREAHRKGPGQSTWHRPYVVCLNSHPNFCLSWPCADSFGDYLPAGLRGPGAWRSQGWPFRSAASPSAETDDDNLHRGAAAHRGITASNGT